MNLSSLLIDMGYAGFAGFVVGFAVRRVLNIFLLLVGLYLVSIMWLASKGIVQVQWDQLFGFIGGMFESLSDFLQGLVTKLAFAGSFTVGFFLGFRS